MRFTTKLRIGSAAGTGLLFAVASMQGHSQVRQTPAAGHASVKPVALVGTVLRVNASAVNAGEVATFDATLTTANAAATPIAGKLVLFQVFGHTVASRTHTDGIAHLTLRSPNITVIRTYPFTASFAQDSPYLAARASGKIVVTGKPEPSSGLLPAASSGNGGGSSNDSSNGSGSAEGSSEQGGSGGGSLGSGSGARPQQPPVKIGPTSIYVYDAASVLITQTTFKAKLISTADNKPIAGVRLTFTLRDDGGQNRSGTTRAGITDENGVATVMMTPKINAAENNKFFQLPTSCQIFVNFAGKPPYKPSDSRGWLTINKL